MVVVLSTVSRWFFKAVDFRQTLFQTATLQRALEASDDCYIALAIFVNRQ